MSLPTPPESLQRLRVLLDGGLLYHNTASSSIELLVPADALTLPEDLPTQNYHMWVAVQLMYIGVYDESSLSGVTDINAGTALERLVRPRIGRLMPLHSTRSNIVLASARRAVH